MPNSGRGDMPGIFKLTKQVLPTLPILYIKCHTNNFKWRKQIVINKEKKITIAIYHAENWFSLREVNCRCCKNPSNVGIVFEGLLIMSACLECLLFSLTLKHLLQHFQQYQFNSFGLLLFVSAQWVANWGRRCGRDHLRVQCSSRSSGVE